MFYGNIICAFSQKHTFLKKIPKKVLTNGKESGRIFKLPKSGIPQTEKKLEKNFEKLSKKY